MSVNSYMARELGVCQRAEALEAHFHRLHEKSVIRWTWVPAPSTVLLNYFSRDAHQELGRFGGFEYHEADEHIDWSLIDLLILPAHGSDVSQRIIDLRLKNPNMLIALWLWDNHLAQVNNLKSVWMSDIYFPSHLSEADYLLNVQAPFGLHVPACTAQWSIAEASECMKEFISLPRSNELLLNYVDYKFAWRSEVLARLRAELPGVAALVMPSNDRGRYFAKSGRERLLEWASHKSTVILPVMRDLSTRFFDSLLAGLVPIVPRLVADFDQVIPPEDQQRLGIVRVDDLETATVAKAVEVANALFDAMGEEGVQRRVDYVLGRHMFSHRIHSLLTAIRAGGAPAMGVRVTSGDQLPLALRFVRN